MDQGEGVEGADRKEDPLDFALWKANKPGEDTSWDSPVGRRPPGLAHRVLGDGRGGARRADSTSTAAGRTCSSPITRTRRRRPWPARGEPLASIWMHNGMIELGGEKMSKSLGNIVGLARRRSRRSAATR